MDLLLLQIAEAERRGTDPAWWRRGGRRGRLPLTHQSDDVRTKHDPYRAVKCPRCKRQLALNADILCIKCEAERESRSFEWSPCPRCGRLTLALGPCAPCEKSGQVAARRRLRSRLTRAER